MRRTGLEEVQRPLDAHGRVVKEVGRLDKHREEGRTLLLVVPLATLLLCCFVATGVFTAVARISWMR